eukprot:scaffold452_cov491-Prasinococcus_capsulatus_cf.AAC.2
MERNVGGALREGPRENAWGRARRKRDGSRANSLATPGRWHAPPPPLPPPPPVAAPEASRPCWSVARDELIPRPHRRSVGRGQVT